MVKKGYGEGRKRNLLRRNLLKARKGLKEKRKKRVRKRENEIY